MVLCFCLQIMVPGSQNTLLLKNLLSETEYKVTVTPIYDDGEGVSVSAPGKTCEWSLPLGLLDVLCNAPSSCSVGGGNGLEVSVAHVCPTLCHPMDCGPPGSSVHGILQERILEWVAFPFSRGSSWLRDFTWVPCIAGGVITIWATREAPKLV